MPLIFLSHSSQNSDLAAQLCQSLEAQGISCWIAPRDLHFGQPFAPGIGMPWPAKKKSPTSLFFSDARNS
jgi:hypothetical protein